MSEINIELKRTEVLELICLLSIQDFAETTQGQLAKSRFERIQKSLENQLQEKSTKAELAAAMAECDSYLDPHVFPDVIGD